MLPSRTDILIVGAGPTGLALAVGLSQAGIDHLLIDALPQGQNTSRAAVIHAHTLEALAKLGVAETLVARGLFLSRFAIRDRDRPLLEIGFDDLPSDHSGLLMVPQSTTEAVLAGRLEDLGGRVHRNARAVEVRQGSGGAEARVVTGEGEQLIRARYVVGGDGMHSVVREAAGISFEGGAYAESFVLADVRMDWPLGATEVSLFFSPAGVLVVAPLPGGSFRIVATLDDAPPAPDSADIQRLLEARGPSGIGDVTEVIWSSRFRVHHRLAETYRHGPFLLMGDSAHVHSPAGGQGMNTGLVDAVVLAEALSRVVIGESGDGLLDDYSGRRRPAADQVLALAGRLTRAAMLRSPLARWLRNLLLMTLNRSGSFKARMKMNLSGLSRRASAELPPRTAGNGLTAAGPPAKAPPCSTSTRSRSASAGGPSLTARPPRCRPAAASG
jgi:2-polyprenyl-6-methoxyphenol hydroxylase-like FAD-dependent oxidoreductase